MSTQDGQKSCPHCSNEQAPNPAHSSPMLTPAQTQLLEYANDLDGPDLVKSLKLVHDIAVYHSHEPLDEDEKDALFSVKVLWEHIERIYG